MLKSEAIEKFVSDFEFTSVSNRKKAIFDLSKDGGDSKNKSISK